MRHKNPLVEALLDFIILVLIIVVTTCLSAAVALSVEEFSRCKTTCAEAEVAK